MNRKPTPAALDIAVVNELKSNIKALCNRAQYLRTCIAEIHEAINVHNVSVEEVCVAANKALKKFGGKPIVPDDIHDLLAEHDSVPDEAEEAFSASVGAMPEKASASSPGAAKLDGNEVFRRSLNREPLKAAPPMSAGSWGRPSAEVSEGEEVFLRSMELGPLKRQQYPSSGAL